MNIVQKKGSIMEIEEIDYRQISQKEEEISLLLGYFDGLHLGHIALIKTAHYEAKYPLCLLSFSAPISQFINNGKESKILTANFDKKRILYPYHIKKIISLKIDADFINLSPLEFIAILKKMNVKEIFVGEDFRFGFQARGDIKLLQEHFPIHVKDIVKIANQKISTSLIKNYLMKGAIKKANKMLGRYYEIVGNIIHGNSIGRTLKYPTANLNLKDNYLLPKNGVYKTICYVHGIPYISITNVGVHPTINQLNQPLVEVHIKDFSGDIYGQTVYLAFLDFIRPEIKFSNLDDLKTQIDKDFLSLEEK